MPLHDWTRVPSGLFHHFHQHWTVEIARSMNRGLLPAGLSAFVEQRAAGWEPDVLTIDARADDDEAPPVNGGGVATLAPPQATIVQRSDPERYAERANRIVVRHELGRVVAAIEIVSPGNKDGRNALRRFVEKSVEFLESGVHLLIVDPFPPTARDPHGIHEVVWNELVDHESFEMPAGKDRLLVSYDASEKWVAYIEPLTIGESLPDMPLFLVDGLHVPVPLESTYAATWEATPAALRNAVETEEDER